MKELYSDIKDLINSYWTTIYADEFFDKERDVEIIESEPYIYFRFKTRKEMFLPLNKLNFFKYYLKQLLGNKKFKLSIKKVKVPWEEYTVNRIDIIKIHM